METPKELGKGSAAKNESPDIEPNWFEFKRDYFKSLFKNQTFNNLNYDFYLNYFESILKASLTNHRLQHT